MSVVLPEIPLWKAEDLPAGEYPEEETKLDDGLPVIRNVSFPSLTPWLPTETRPGSPAVIVAPGGAWHFLAHVHEGTQVCSWLNKQGIPAFLLKYRLLQTGPDFPACVGRNMADRERFNQLLAPLVPALQADAAEAVALVRRRAAEWGVNPAAVGMLGFSAGGMVTFQAALGKCRPDFAAPVYPAPFHEEAKVHAGSPPLFLLCAADDAMAVESTSRAFAAWNKAGAPAELHIYQEGGHGFGMNRRGMGCDDWIERFYAWLKAGGFLAV